MFRKKQQEQETTALEYWEQYEEKDGSQMNHDINLDISVDFLGLNGKVYHIKEKSINCNPNELDSFMQRLKKVIRMVDEEIGDKTIEQW